MFRTNFHRIRSYSKHANIVCKRHNSSRVNSFIERWKQNTIPVWAGLSVIGIVQYLKIRKRHEDEINLALEEGRLQKVDVDVSFKVRLYNSVPLESLSRFVGDLGRREIPKWARSHLLSIYCSCYGVNMDEALISDLSEYSTFNEFFRRRLKNGCRPIDNEAYVVSPCDAKVLHCGLVDQNGQVEQVKGMNYSMEDFLGYNPQNMLNNDHKLVQITMYLAPGDYHCFHSPIDWKIDERRHFKGKLLSVKPSIATWMPKLFAQNERVVYSGKKIKDSSFFSFAAVGATNVGSIVISIDPDLNTNCKNAQYNECKTKKWTQQQLINKGSFFGEFNLGSTVVLIFEAPKNFEFKVHPGDTIRVGQCL